MLISDLKKLKDKFKVGDVVIVPKELAELTHEERGSQIAEVSGIYPHLFNVKYGIGFEQSIKYVDANKVVKIMI